MHSSKENNISFLKIASLNLARRRRSDSTENYTCCYKDGSQEQITLFTAAAWVNDSSKTTCETHCNISDDHGHDKWSESVFLDTVINEFIAKKHPQVKMVDVFPDGPASQFKNKYMEFTPGWRLRDFRHSDQRFFHSKWCRREAILFLKFIFVTHSFPLNCRITGAHVHSVVAICESSRGDLSFETFLKVLRQVYPL